MSAKSLYKRFLKKMLTKKDLSAYLPAYFKDDTHSLYFATSDDGYTFTDKNYGRILLR
ncbi:hypothetical protein FACS189411_13910 [Bacteroidia bacterium]|nr:hypothetical protein FACS189411_13910 [Bacteroidia bacterium]